MRPQSMCVPFPSPNCPSWGRAGVAQSKTQLNDTCWQGSVFLCRFLLLTNICWTLTINTITTTTSIFSAINTWGETHWRFLWLRTESSPYKCAMHGLMTHRWQAQGHRPFMLTFRPQAPVNNPLPRDPGGSAPAKKSGDIPSPGSAYPSSPSRGPCSQPTSPRSCLWN